MLEDIKEIQKQQEKHQEDEEKRYGDMDPKSMMQSAMSSVKTPSLSNFKAPTFSMPHF